MTDFSETYVIPPPLTTDSSILSSNLSMEPMKVIPPPLAMDGIALNGGGPTFNGGGPTPFGGGPGLHARRFPCTSTGCGQSFTREDDRHRHILEHHEKGNSVPCPDCGQTMLKRSLNRHQKICKKKAKTDNQRTMAMKKMLGNNSKLQNLLASPKTTTVISPGGNVSVLNQPLINSKQLQELQSLLANPKTSAVLVPGGATVPVLANPKTNTVVVPGGATVPVFANPKSNTVVVPGGATVCVPNQPLVDTKQILSSSSNLKKLKDNSNTGSLLLVPVFPIIKKEENAETPICSVAADSSQSAQVANKRKADKIAESDPVSSIDATEKKEENDCTDPTRQSVESKTNTTPEWSSQVTVKIEGTDNSNQVIQVPKNRISEWLKEVINSGNGGKRQRISIWAQ